MYAFGRQNDCSLNSEQLAFEFSYDIVIANYERSDLFCADFSSQSWLWSLGNNSEYMLVAVLSA